MLEWAVASGASVLLVLLVRRLFKGRISPGLQYGLWLLVLARLLVPVNLFDTDLSVLNLFARWEESGQEGGAEPDISRPEEPAAGLDMTAPEPLPGMVSKPDSQGSGSPGKAAGVPTAGEKTPVPGSGREPEVSYREGESREEAKNTAGEAAGKTAWLTKALGAVWILGMLFTAGALAGINLHFYRRLLRARRPVELRDGSGRMPEKEKGSEREKGLERKRGPAVYRVRTISGPCLFGLLHPAIYLPEGIAEEQLPYVLAHEESHYRAGDPLWALLRSLCLVLHWYNPLVWLAALVSRQDSELACDARTVRRLGEERRNAYGRILVDLTVQKLSAADFLCCATTMTAKGRSLKERVELIVRKPRLSAAAGGLAAALLTVVFCVACTGARDTSAEQKGTVAEEACKGALEEAHNRALMEVLDSREEELPDRSDEDTYYRAAENTEIQDVWFTMELPEGLVGQVGYRVTLGENEAGEKYLQALDFFHIASVEAGMPEEEPGQGRRRDYRSGWLCGYSWTGYPDIAADLEEIAYRSGARDIQGMDFLLSRDYDGYAGVSGRLVQANSAGTGAYFYTEPSDVQWTEETREEYLACAEGLAAYWDRFAAKSFPYEELEGFFQEPSAGMPRWREDFEEAERIYAWFTSAGQAPVKAMRNDGGEYGTYTAPDGLVYGEADIPGVSNMEDFRIYLGRWFEPELAEDLLSGRKPSLEQSPGSFMEVDGKLYALVGWISELQSVPRERQYAAYFTELTDTGQERPIGVYAENGGRRRAQIYTNCRYDDDISSPEAILCYTMEEQEDGSWRIVGDYELAALQLLNASQE